VSSSCLTVKTDVKHDVCSRHPEVLRGLGDIVSALNTMVEKGSVSGVAPMLLGVASILANLTVSVSILREVTPFCACVLPESPRPR
jgi:hypothetical protein